MKQKLYISRFVPLIAILFLGLATSTHSYAEDSNAPIVVGDKSPAGELKFWNTIKDSKNSSDFKAYLTNFPNGMFFDPAMRMFEAVGGSKADLASFLGADNKSDKPAVIQKQKVEKKKPVVKKAAAKPKKKQKIARVAQKTAKTQECRVYLFSTEGDCKNVRKSKTIKDSKVKKRYPSTDVNDSGGNSGGGSAGGNGWGG